MKTRIKPDDTILFVTLGCSKNVVDSERLMSQLAAHGLKVAHERDDAKARTVIINTCGFILDAKKESIDTILSYVKAKKQGRIDNLFVMGCLSERYANELRQEIPEVDQYFGANSLKPIVESLGYNYQENLLGERWLTTPSHYAFFKISEGCNRTCAFCAIPSMRGKYQSFPIEQLVNEARLLAAKGVKELIVIAQDTSNYGYDLYRKSQLSHLIQKISEVDGIEWIRLHYMYPVDFPDDLLEVIKNNPKVCKYIDMPVQHISDNVLARMRRGHTREHLVELIDRIRQTIPGICLRTTFLVGFPGETDEDFEELCRFVETAQFDRAGVFTYSHEENTYAGNNYSDHIPYSIKKKRADQLMAIQQKVSEKKNEQKIGQTLKVIVDRMEDEFFIGRTEFDSPEVDNEVLIKKQAGIQVGNFYSVKITDADAFDLWGEITNV
ncbi:MAG TPA: 30S ribosomal protein S12 methylthiotransferase RimO [Bacteroidales bacterium]|nr:30S ribosomal protein S12 methylthiotransferase RimO [Bacteroidales bacterium]HOK99114.1 30S ribosomal protein S12 methylthiotransferase RimO [Bacteroidales bacterium]HPO65906.1 30S ribosomal protein S12 methylthiotransferase RimO [Bacteroidales bacterium]